MDITSTEDGWRVELDQDDAETIIAALAEHRFSVPGPNYYDRLFQQMRHMSENYCLPGPENPDKPWVGASWCMVIRDRRWHFYLCNVATDIATYMRVRWHRAGMPGIA